MVAAAKAGQTSQQQAVLVEKFTQYLGNGEYPLPVVHIGQDSRHPFPPNQCAFLCAGRTKKPGLTGKGHEEVVAAVQIFPDGGPNNCPKIHVFRLIPFLITAFILLEITIGDLVEITFFRIPLFVHSAYHTQPTQQSCQKWQNIMALR